MKDYSEGNNKVKFRSYETFMLKLNQLLDDRELVFEKKRLII